MKKALFFLFTLFLISTSYATEDQEIQYKISPEFSGIEQYYKTDLSNSDIEDIKKIYGIFREQLLNSITNKNYTSCENNLRGNINTLYKGLYKYVDTKNYTKYQEYITKNSSPVGITNYTCTIELEKIYTIKKLLTDQMKNSINAKIEKIPEEKRQATLEKLILFINKQNPNNERKKQLYLEIKEYIQLKIDDLENQSILPADFSNL